MAGSFERLLSLGSVLYVGLPLVGIASLMALRQREPELPRPFRCWGYPLPPLLIGAGLVAQCRDPRAIVRQARIIM